MYRGGKVDIYDLDDYNNGVVIGNGFVSSNRY